MADFSQALGIDPATFEDRLKFLSARAQRHIEQPDGHGRSVPRSYEMHLACAATLRRDAGAIALILGRVEQARLEFRKAGYIRLQLGFYDGFYLLRLGETGDGDDRRTLRDERAWLELSLSGGEREREGLPPYAAAASRSPRQLISVLQAANVENTLLEAAVELALERLKVYKSHLLGVTQTSIERYLKLFFELRRGELGSSTRTLIGMSIKREELMAAAQRDQFHWRLAQKPADLIDMDLLSLGITALESDGHLFERVRDIAGEFDPMVRIPFDAARLLCSFPPRETPLRSAPH